jgi:hypothetical protein
MVRIVLLLLVLVIGFVAVFRLDALGIGQGIKPGGSASKEEPLSVTVSKAAIDERQPQHLETATFALG